MSKNPFVELAVAACVALLGCQKSSPPPVQSPEEPGPEELRDKRPMDDHFLKASAIKEAIIQGELEAVREPARWIDQSMENDDVPLQWKDHVPAIRSAARKVADAADLEQAAVAASQMAGACGSCHTAVSVEMVVTVDEPPDPSGGTFPHMMRHQWAADRMYEGLIAPSDEAWTKGAEALATAPLHRDEAKDKAAVPAEVATLAGKVHGLGMSAKTETNVEQRIGHYAELISTCAQCHRLTSS